MKVSYKIKNIETGKVFKNKYEASKWSGSEPWGIIKCCQGLRKHAGNLHWEYLEKEYKPYGKRNTNNYHDIYNVNQPLLELENFEEVPEYIREIEDDNIRYVMQAFLVWISDNRTKINAILKYLKEEQ